jgi:hypothetical protein
MSEHDDTTSNTVAGQDIVLPEETTAEGDTALAETTSPTEDPAGCDRSWCGTEPSPGSLVSRPMLGVASLTAHPGNVRLDLDLDAELLAPIEANGVLVPLTITLQADEHGDAVGYLVIDGHRRLVAAVKTGLAEVPYDLVTDRQGDEARQYLDMFPINRQRKPLRPQEEAAALFAAHEAGASRTDIRKATGLKAPAVKAALAAATLSAETREAVGALEDDLTLEDLAILAEFQDDPEALSQLMRTAGYGDSLDTARSGYASSARSRPRTNGCGPGWRPPGSPSPTPCPQARNGWPTCAMTANRSPRRHTPAARAAAPAGRRRLRCRRPRARPGPAHWLWGHARTWHLSQRRYRRGGRERLVCPRRAASDPPPDTRLGPPR